MQIPVSFGRVPCGVFAFETTTALAKCRDRPKPGVDWTRYEKERLILRAADLSGAILEHTDLSESDMTEAKLTGAKMVQANLSRARLHGADLSGADMTKAQAEGAHGHRVPRLGQKKSPAVVKAISTLPHHGCSKHP